MTGLQIAERTRTTKPRNQTLAAFEADKLRAAQRNIHVITSIVSVVNLLLIISDLLFIQGRTERLAIVLARYCFSILLIIMIRVLQNARSFTSFTAMVTILEAMAVLLYLFVLWIYETPNFMIQTMGLITLILILFVVPNRLWHMLTLAISSAAAYFLLFQFFIQSQTVNELVAAIAYTQLAIVICSVTMFVNDRYAYGEYTKKARLEQTSSKDYLTNVVTRARLEEEAQRWMSFCRRQGLPLCLVFVDVDDLKRINDKHGHAAGDIVLKGLAQLMQKQLRSSDTIARWGGDEFVLLLPNVSLNKAVLLLDRVKQAVQLAEFEEVGAISCSYGVVEMGPDSTYQQLLAEADTMMYRSKRAGKGGISYREGEELASKATSNS